MSGCVESCQPSGKKKALIMIGAYKFSVERSCRPRGESKKWWGPGFSWNKLHSKRNWRDHPKTSLKTNISPKCKIYLLFLSGL